MNRFLAALALLLLAATGAAAQTNVVWGLATGANPRNLCVYDSTHACVTTGTLDSTLHVFTPSIHSGTVTGSMLAAGAAAANLGFTPFNPANQLPPASGGTGLSTFTRSGNTTDFATAIGTFTPGHCVSIDSNGNFIDAGGACTTGGGGGTVTAGTVGQLAYYSGGTNTGSFALAGDCTFAYPNITCLKSNGVTLGALATLTPGTGVSTALAASLNAASGLVGYSGALGTPTSGTLTYATGLPISTGVSGLGASVATALGNTAGAAGGFATYNQLGSLATITPGTGVATALGNTAGAAGGFATFNQLGSAAFGAIGTSGATIPLLNGTNFWSGVQTFTNANTYFNSTNAGGYTNLYVQNPSTTAGSTAQIQTATGTSGSYYSESVIDANYASVTAGSGLVNGLAFTTAAAAPISFLTNSTNRFTITAVGDASETLHYLNTSAAPTLSSCGTSPTVAAGSGNQGGQITLGTGTVTACTVTFSTAYPNHAFCTISAAFPAASILAYISSAAGLKTGFTVTTASSDAGASFTYACNGQ